MDDDFDSVESDVRASSRSRAQGSRARRRGHARGLRMAVAGFELAAAQRVGASNVRLRVDSLDAAGKPIASTDAYVPDVPAGGRVYFEAPVKERAPRYRVTITSWDWREASGQ